MAENRSSSILVRHEFLIRRLHSLTGLIPVGAFMTVHLLANASVLAGPETFQKNVYSIHALGPLLPLVEWAFIFIPILFHAILGVVIVAGCLPNTGNYPYGSNIRYTLQRASGLIAFAFIVWHVFHMHGWFHAEWWLQSTAEPLGGAQFRAYNAASTAGAALQSVVIAGLYALGVTACVYHLANGLWTMGITWGVWTSPQAQRRAEWLCAAVGVGLLVVGLGGLFGMRAVDTGQALQAEDQMYEAKSLSWEIQPAPHKRLTPEEKEQLLAHEGDEVATGSGNNAPTD